MAGIYIHIPFCRQACHYCDFHFSTTLKEKDRMVDAIIKEIELRKKYLRLEIVKTIYFGGGTPSILEKDQTKKILEKIYNSFLISTEAEVTLEANPDDLSPGKLQELKDIGINRLSIGIQSFFDDDLNYFNRAHTAVDAIDCIVDAKAAGFDDLTIDLIYGVPGMSIDKWKKNIETAIAFHIPHISCYCLTVEKGTALDHFITNKQSAPIDDELANEHFRILMELMQKHGYEQYEISNFCLPGNYSKHNTSYWNGELYLGVGPSAHSYNDTSRQWNISNNHKYMQSIETGIIPCDIEETTPLTAYNDYILTSLRTKWGCDFNFILKKFGTALAEPFKELAEKEIEKGFIQNESNIFKLTTKGKYFADRVASNLFILNKEIYENYYRERR
jgi:putative oxygen-independent coproporphyrinogen III oxidase